MTLSLRYHPYCQECSHLGSLGYSHHSRTFSLELRGISSGWSGMCSRVALSPCNGTDRGGDDGRSRCRGLVLDLQYLAVEA